MSFQINAHPVLEGNSGYAHISISGEPNSILALAASAADQRERFSPEFSLNTFEDRNLQVQNGIPFPGKLDAKNDDQLIVLSDGGDLSDDDVSTTTRGRRRLPGNMRPTAATPNEACAVDVVKCDGTCQCATCEDESECQNRFFRLISSPTLNELKPTGFWKVVRIPGNGTVSVRVPFTSHGRVAISAMSIGTRGI